MVSGPRLRSVAMTTKHHIVNTQLSGKVLLTGASGFIGGRLRDALLSQGCDVLAIRRKGSPAAKTGRSVELDYADSAGLTRLMREERPEYVLHVAGATKGVTYNDFLDANVMPTTNLVAAVREGYPELKRFVKEFHTRFSARYDHDPRLAFVQTGFGLWAARPSGTRTRAFVLLALYAVTMLTLVPSLLGGRAHLHPQARAAFLVTLLRGQQPVAHLCRQKLQHIASDPHPNSALQMVKIKATPERCSNVSVL